ncbi:MAG: Dihydrolipoamide succinyltransferase component (E2) of 2-oxoglutarate dehydrogenase complex, partial [uncultured Craurococcus sp.]
GAGVHRRGAEARGAAQAAGPGRRARRRPCATARRRQADGREQGECRADRRWHRQGRPHQQGRRARFPLAPGRCRGAGCRHRQGGPAAGGGRGAGEDDPAAHHHRAPAEGGAEHRCHAHHLQRGGYGRGHGAARRVPRRFREAAWREARLHVLLREGLRRRAEGIPRGQCRDRGRFGRLQEFRPYGHRGRRAERAGGAGAAQRRPDELRRDREDHRRSRQARPRRAAQAGGDGGRQLHHHQWRHLWQPDVDADPEPAAVRHPRDAQDPGAADGRRRQGRGAADDVPGPVLRPPHRRREGGGQLPRPREGRRRGPAPADAGPL